MLLVALLFIFSVEMTQSAKISAVCNLLTTCAIEKCLDSALVDSIIGSSPRDEIFGNLVERFDMVCIASKCGKECSSCKQCHYALEQMSALAQGEKTSGLCPKLEGCVENCLTEDVNQVLSCVAKRCNVHCYDGDCPSCRQMSKRMFSAICKNTSMTKLPQIKYEGTCPNLFMELADEYVANHQKKSA
ncbi:unnamed protein product [Caenorhabditis auriculariae]|uniref:Uncharacterized protein n=1 Tax=Caenorhabditis auriculariae TaxID=2777116 RepID=A0A8S1HMY8_9PELO|nr:unnamed protein product [Caenorhabditis auriculariae]